MRPRPLLILVAMLTLVPSMTSSHEREDLNDEPVVHGTINIALGNKNGIVVLTDSMVTRGDVQLPAPGQKLFKLDDNTVCSFAGFISAPTPLADFNSDTRAVIYEYIRQSQGQKPQTIAEKLAALAFLFRMRIDTIANMRDVVGIETGVDSYAFQVIVAGYDLDGAPKIGKIELRTSREHGELRSSISEGSLSVVGGGQLVKRLNGMPDITEHLLSHPEDGPQNDPVLKNYAQAKRNDDGASLTTDEMVELAKQLALYTSRTHREVGGKNQIAILTGPHRIQLDQQPFPVPPRPIVNFGLAVDFHVDSFGPIGYGSREVFVRCSWRNANVPLDGNYFVGSTIDSASVSYNGRSFDLGNTNQVRNSILVVGPLIRPDDRNVRRLSREFTWVRIVRDFSSGAANFY